MNILEAVEYMVNEQGKVFHPGCADIQFWYITESGALDSTPSKIEFITYTISFYTFMDGFEKYEEKLPERKKITLGLNEFLERLFQRKFIRMHNRHEGNYFRYEKSDLYPNGVIVNHQNELICPALSGDIYYYYEDEK